MMCAVWLILKMRDSILYVFILVKAIDALMFCTQAVCFSLGRNTHRERVWIYQTRQVLCLAIWPLPESLRIDRGHQNIAVWIWRGWPIRLHFWHAPPRMGHQWQCQWFHQRIHSLRLHFLWYSLTVGLDLILRLMQVDINPWQSSVYEPTIYWLHTKTHLWGDHFQSRFLPHWWWCILLVLLCYQRADTGRESLVFLQLQCMLTIFVRLNGRVGMQHQGLFSL